MRTVLELGEISSDLATVAERLRGSVVAIRSGHGFGAGTVWADGVVITNAHVAGRSRVVGITASDGVAREGQVVALDRANDLALIRVDGTGLVPVATGDVSTMRPGALVLAVGNPLGQPGSVTVGALVSPSVASGAGRDLVRTDLRLAPGNSGGPAADAEGRVIGINAMVYGGLGLAVPTHVVTVFLAEAHATAAAA